MKLLHKIVIAVFAIILLIPAVCFNFKEPYESELDNRMLATNPFADVHTLSDTESLGASVSAYVSDRIGMRSQAVRAYSAINNSLFCIMEHPYYMQGQDGYIFIRKNSNVVYSDFHRDFAMMVVQIDAYCKARGVPFLFVFEPEKLSVLREYAPVWMNYDDSWVDEFLAILDENGVRYVDNTDLLTELQHSGTSVFNWQYDAGHWNDTGAFYGVNNILSAMREDCPGIHINTEDEFEISEKLNVDLQQNGVRVEEYAPDYKPKKSPQNRTDEYRSEIRLNENYHYFRYTENPEVESPRVLMFQGSYMNTRGYKFIQNALGEYIAVHDYQNIFDFEYYYELFRPEYVVFEAAEYTFLDLYFDEEKLADFTLSPTYESFDGFGEETHALSELPLSTASGEKVETLTVSPTLPCDYAYYLDDTGAWSLQPCDNGYEISLLKESQRPYRIVLVDTVAKKRYLYQ